MASNYNTSANKTKNTSYNYSPSQEPMVSANRTDKDKRFNYSEIYSKAASKSSAPSTKNKTKGSTAVGINSITMGQVQNFSFYIQSINEADTSFKVANKGLCLPLKSLDFVPAKLEHLKIKAGVFMELPFFHRRDMATIKCSMHDSHRGLIYAALKDWWDTCVYSNGIVSYIADMCRTAKYTEYTFDGKVSVAYEFIVMPTGELKINKRYDGEGELNVVDFDLIVVSDINRQTLINPQWTEGHSGIKN